MTRTSFRSRSRTGVLPPSGEKPNEEVRTDEGDAGEAAGAPALGPRRAAILAARSWAIARDTRSSPAHAMKTAIGTASSEMRA